MRGCRIIIEPSILMLYVTCYIYYLCYLHLLWLTWQLFNNYSYLSFYLCYYSILLIGLYTQIYGSTYCYKFSNLYKLLSCTGSLCKRVSASGLTMFSLCVKTQCLYITYISSKWNQGNREGFKNLLSIPLSK